ncbi:MAG: organomercurial lyase [Caldilineaceae bacterium]
MNDTLLWRVRTFIYQHFAATTSAPDLTDIAQHFQLSNEEATGMLKALHDIHALFLDPGTTNIRIANPFSAVPTPFIVDVNGKRYWANCAWDSFGVIAALQAAEGVIRASCTQSGIPLHLEIQQGEVVGTTAMIHFLIPFRQWYEDMIFT